MQREKAFKRSQLGAVRRLPSGRYQARYKLNCEIFKAPNTFETKQEARTWIAGELSDRARGVWVNPNGNPLGQYAKQWLESRIDLSKATRARYSDALRLYILADYDGFSLAQMPLGQITPQYIRQWLTLASAKAKQASLDRQSHKSPRKQNQPHQHPARIWAKAQGLEVAESGKLPKNIYQAWASANPKAAKAYKPPKSKGRDATGHAKEIRAWGLANGWQVAACGKLPDGLTQAWLEQHSPKVSEDEQTKERFTEPGAPTTAKAYATLRTIFNAAISDGLLKFNPCRIKGAGQYKAMERTPATVEEVQAIANAMPKHLASSVIVAAWSGLRRGELFSLARKHVDLETGAIRVERTLTRDRTFSTPKTRSSIRTVYLPRFVVDVLAEHMATYTGKDPDALIWSSEGKPIREATVSANYKKARTKAGRPELRWHDLRHTGATLAYQAGGNVRDVQRRLGHATARAAMIYAHAADNGDKLLAQRLDEAFSPKHEPTPPTPPAPTPLAQQQLGAIARPVFRVIQGGKAIA